MLDLAWKRYFNYTITTSLCCTNSCVISVKLCVELSENSIKSFFVSETLFQKFRHNIHICISQYGHVMLQCRVSYQELYCFESFSLSVLRSIGHPSWQTICCSVLNESCLMECINTLHQTAFIQNRATNCLPTRMTYASENWQWEWFKAIQFLITHPTLKHDMAILRNAYVDIVPKFLKKCFWNKKRLDWIFWQFYTQFYRYDTTICTTEWCSNCVIEIPFSC